MSQFWIAVFFILLAIAELYQSIKEIDLPLPVYLGLGIVLAIASNYQQWFSFDSTFGAAASVADRQIIPLQSIIVDPALSPIQASLQVEIQPKDVD